MPRPGLAGPGAACAGQVVHGSGVAVEQLWGLAVTRCLLLILKTRLVLVGS